MKKTLPILLALLLVAAIAMFAACSENIITPIKDCTDGHTWSEKIITQDCEQGGTLQKTCTVCGKVETSDWGPAEHVWGSPDITQNPTCTVAGKQTVTCTVCGKSGEQEIPAAHTKGDKVDAVAATCTQSGMQQYWKCVNCDAKLDADGNAVTDEQLVVAALGHKYRLDATQGDNGWTWTGTEGAVAHFKCANDNCPDPIKDVTAQITSQKVDNTTTYTATATVPETTDETVTDTKTVTDTPQPQQHVHVYGQPTWVWEDDFSKATATFTCTGDGDCDQPTVTVVAEGESISSQITQEANCTTPGQQTYTAHVQGPDGKPYMDAKIEDLGNDPDKHDFSKPVEQQEPTCTEPGHTAGRQCSRCDATQDVDEIPAKGHSYTLASTPWTWSQDNAQATLHLVCSNDADHTQEIDVDSTSQSASADCTTPGDVTYTVTITKEELSQQLNLKPNDKLDVEETNLTATQKVSGVALGHNFEAKFDWPQSYDNKTLPEVTVTLDCSRCEEEITKGLTVTEKGTHEAPTCTQGSSATFTASVEYEGKTYTDEHTYQLDPTGHSWVVDTNNRGWIWGEYNDGNPTVTVDIKCANCTGTKTIDATATLVGQVEQSTCTQAGKATYSASAQYEKATFNTTENREYTLPLAAHQWGKTYTSVGESGHYRTCTVCSTHDVTVGHTLSAKPEQSTDKKHIYKCTADGCGYTKEEACTVVDGQCNKCDADYRTEVTVYFHKADGWTGTIKAYAWYGTDEAKNKHEVLGGWPGTEMNSVSEKLADVGGWHKITFKVAEEHINADLYVIVNNKVADVDGGKQTSDVKVTASTIYIPGVDSSIGDVTACITAKEAIEREKSQPTDWYLVGVLHGVNSWPDKQGAMQGESQQLFFDGTYTQVKFEFFKGDKFKLKNIIDDSWLGYLNLVEQGHAADIDISKLFSDVDGYDHNIQVNEACTVYVKLYTDSQDGHHSIAVYVESLTHTHVKDTVKGLQTQTDPGCETTGQGYYLCRGCDKHIDENGNELSSGKYITIPATGHKDVHKVEKQDATCTAVGYKAHFECKTCGKWFEESDTSYQHSMEAKAQEFEIAMTAHTYQVTSVAWAADISGAATQPAIVVKCKNCVATLTEGAEGYSVQYTSDETAAKCDAEGSKTYTITVTFGEQQLDFADGVQSSKTYTLPALVHNWKLADGEPYTWDVSEDAAKITFHLVCENGDNCDVKMQDVVVDGEEYFKLEITDQPNCNKQGTGHYVVTDQLTADVVKGKATTEGNFTIDSLQVAQSDDVTLSKNDTHNFTGAIKMDEGDNNTHSYLCTNGCDQYGDPQSCTAKGDGNYFFDETGTQHWQLCECGRKLNVADHQYSNKDAYTHNDGLGTHNKKCDICGNTQSEDCTAKKEYEHDNDFHWHLCQYCNAVISSTRQEHNFIGDDNHCEQCNVVKSQVEISWDNGGAQTHNVDDLQAAIQYITSQKDGALSGVTDITITLANGTTAAAFGVPDGINLTLVLGGDYTVSGGTITVPTGASLAIRSEGGKNVRPDSNYAAKVALTFTQTLISNGGTLTLDKVTVVGWGEGTVAVHNKGTLRLANGGAISASGTALAVESGRVEATDGTITGKVVVACNGEVKLPSGFVAANLQLDGIVCDNANVAIGDTKQSHIYTAVWTWQPNETPLDSADTIPTASATVTCSICGDKHESVNATVTKNDGGTDPTCESTGTATFTAKVEGYNLEGTSEVYTIKALGHTWKVADTPWTWAEDFSKAYFHLVCTTDGQHTKQIEVTPETDEGTPTCTAVGKVTHTATISIAEITEQTSGDNIDQLSEQSYTNTVDGVDIPALGHEWKITNVDLGEVDFANKTASLTVTLTCQRGENGCNSSTHTVTLEGVKSTSEIEATCTQAQVLTFSCNVAAEVENLLTDEHNGSVANGDELQDLTATGKALGHNYTTGEGAWSWQPDGDNYNVTLTLTCSRCKDGDGYTKVLTKEGIAPETTTPATCDKAGSKFYTVTFTAPEDDATNTYPESMTGNHTDTIEALGHEWEITDVALQEGSVNFEQKTATLTVTLTCQRSENGCESSTHTVTISGVEGVETTAALCTVAQVLTFSGTVRAVDKTVKLDELTATKALGERDTVTGSKEFELTATGEALGHDFEEYVDSVYQESGRGHVVQCHRTGCDVFDDESNAQPHVYGDFHHIDGTETHRATCSKCHATAPLPCKPVVSTSGNGEQEVCPDCKEHYEITVTVHFRLYNYTDNDNQSNSKTWTPAGFRIYAYSGENDKILGEGYPGKYLDTVKSTGTWYSTTFTVRKGCIANDLFVILNDYYYTDRVKTGDILVTAPEIWINAYSNAAVCYTSKQAAEDATKPYSGWTVAGTFNNWSLLAGFEFTSSSKLVLNLKAGTEFKVVNGSSWYGYGNGNIQIKDTNGGSLTWDKIAYKDSYDNNIKLHYDCRLVFTVSGSSAVITVIGRKEKENDPNPFIEEHVLGTKHEAKDPTCSTGGNVEYWICKNCGAKLDATGKVLYDITLPATGVHKGQEVKAQEATCQADGWNAFYKCSECGMCAKTEYGEYKYTEDAIKQAVKRDKLGHSYKLADEAWTWNITGDTVTVTLHLVCATCSDPAQTRDIPFTYQEDSRNITWSQSVAATCTEAAKGTYTVSISNSDLLAKLHEIADENTATLDGTVTKTISATSEATTRGEALGHSYKVEWQWQPDYSWNSNQLPTVTAVLTCTNGECGDTQTITQDITVSLEGSKTPPTCEAAGSASYTAKFSYEGTEYSTEAPHTYNWDALGHNYQVAWGELQPEGEGYKCTITFTCNRCTEGDGHTYTETVSAAKPQGDGDYLAPTCEVDGYQKYSVTFTKKEGQNYNETSTTKTVTLAALGHSFVPDKGEGHNVGYTFGNDGANGTLTIYLMCQHENSHKVTITVGMVGTETQPTCEANGYYTFEGMPLDHEAIKEKLASASYSDGSNYTEKDTVAASVSVTLEQQKPDSGNLATGHLYELDKSGDYTDGYTFGNDGANGTLTVYLVCTQCQDGDHHNATVTITVDGKEAPATCESVQTFTFNKEVSRSDVLSALNKDKEPKAIKDKLVDGFATISIDETITGEDRLGHSYAPDTTKGDGTGLAWANDQHTQVTVYLVCNREDCKDSRHETTVTLTVEGVSHDGTSCGDTSNVTYTCDLSARTEDVKAELDKAQPDEKDTIDVNQFTADNKIEYVADETIVGHTWQKQGDIVWNTGKESATATITLQCTKCKADISVEFTLDNPQQTAATCTTDAVYTYTLNVSATGVLATALEQHSDVVHSTDTLTEATISGTGTYTELGSATGHTWVLDTSKGDEQSGITWNIDELKATAHFKCEKCTVTADVESNIALTSQTTGANCQEYGTGTYTLNVDKATLEAGIAAKVGQDVKNNFGSVNAIKETKEVENKGLVGPHIYDGQPYVATEDGTQHHQQCKYCETYNDPVDHTWVATIEWKDTATLLDSTMDKPVEISLSCQCGQEVECGNEQLTFELSPNELLPAGCGSEGEVTFEVTQITYQGKDVTIPEETKTSQEYYVKPTGEHEQWKENWELPENGVIPTSENVGCKLTCSECGTLKETTITVKENVESRLPASCTDNGEAYYVAEAHYDENGVLYKDITVEIPATGHNWVLDTSKGDEQRGIVWNLEELEPTATVYFKCSHEDCFETVSVDSVVTLTQNKGADCKTTGTGTYTLNKSAEDFENAIKGENVYTEKDTFDFAALEDVTKVEDGKGIVGDHVWDEEYHDVGDGYHAHQCTVCKEYDKATQQPHSYGSELHQEADGTGHYKLCTACNAKGEEEPHSYTEQKYSTSQHWMQCACGAQNTPVSHTYTYKHNGTNETTKTHTKSCSCGYSDSVSCSISSSTNTCSYCKYNFTVYYVVGTIGGKICWDDTTGIKMSYDVATTSWVANVSFKRGDGFQVKKAGTWDGQIGYNNGGLSLSGQITYATGVSRITNLIMCAPADMAKPDGDIRVNHTCTLKISMNASHQLSVNVTAATKTTSYTYTFYLYDSYNWGAIRIHMWNSLANPNGENFDSAPLMDSVGNGWFKYTRTVTTNYDGAKQGCIMYQNGKNGNRLDFELANAVYLDSVPMYFNNAESGKSTTQFKSASDAGAPSSPISNNVPVQVATLPPQNGKESYSPDVAA